MSAKLDRCDTAGEEPEDVSLLVAPVKDEEELAEGFRVGERGFLPASVPSSFGCDRSDIASHECGPSS